MRRLVQIAIGLWVLAIGPLAPSLHLATVPHQYCASHHAFEKVDPPLAPEPLPDPERRPERPEREHQTCPLATLVLQGVQHDPGLTLLTETLSGRPDPFLLQPSVPPPLAQETISLAPKTSPPSPT